MLHNMRINRCIRYHLRGLSRASLIYTLVFLAVDILLPTLLYFFIGQRVINGSNFVISVGGGQVSSTTFWFSSLIFLFVSFCASFREDFNHLLAMNNTRRSQFLSTLPVMVISSLVFVVGSMVIRILENFMEALINGTGFSLLLGDYMDNFAVSQLAVTGSELLLLLAAFLVVCNFGQLAGIMMYRFGRVFTIPFWICFGGAFVFVPILASGNQLFIRFLNWFIGVDQPFPAVTLGIHFLALAVILMGLSGLFIRKMPLNA